MRRPAVYNFVKFVQLSQLHQHNKSYKIKDDEIKKDWEAFHSKRLWIMICKGWNSWRCCLESASIGDHSTAAVRISDNRFRTNLGFRKPGLCNQNRSADRILVKSIFRSVSKIMLTMTQNYSWLPWFSMRTTFSWHDFLLCWPSSMKDVTSAANGNCANIINFAKNHPKI